LAATVASTTQINLTWTASTDNVGVTGYRVERCQGMGCTNFVEIAAPTATSFSNTGLTAATSYSYRVRATDAAGNLSGYSNVVSATTGTGQVQAYYIHPDHLNTPRLIANSTGTTVWRWDQGEPFGNDVPNNNPSGLGAFDFPLRLPGQYYDKDTALHYNTMRDYDPSIGRYVESDPIGLDGGLNTYLYVVGDPISNTDPDGLRGSSWSRSSSPESWTSWTCPAHSAMRALDVQDLRARLAASLPTDTHRAMHNLFCGCSAWSPRVWGFRRPRWLCGRCQENARVHVYPVRSLSILAMMQLWVD
jgi:RHS repeat-associated protein